MLTLSGGGHRPVHKGKSNDKGRGRSKVGASPAMARSPQVRQVEAQRMSDKGIDKDEHKVEDQDDGDNANDTNDAEDDGHDSGNDDDHGEGGAGAIARSRPQDEIDSDDDMVILRDLYQDDGVVTATQQLATFRSNVRRLHR